MSEPLPTPPPAGADLTAGDGEGRALSPAAASPVAFMAQSGAFSAEVPDAQVTPTTPASSDSARGFGFDLSAHLYGRKP